MLKLTRYEGQKIIVTHEASGHQLTVEVLDVAEDQNANPQVRLGFTAPRTFLIDREEVHKRRQAEEIGGNR